MKAFLGGADAQHQAHVKPPFTSHPHQPSSPLANPHPCSITPTFAACAVFLNNARWDGVPFLLKAGKALESRTAEIRVQFRHVPGSLYHDKLNLAADAASNELVIRIQPNESIYLKINNKVPGLGLNVDTTRLDLSYDSRYQTHLPGMNECGQKVDRLNDGRLFWDTNQKLWDVYCVLLSPFNTVDNS